MSRNIIIPGEHNRTVRYRKRSPSTKTKCGILERYTYKTETGELLTRPNSLENVRVCNSNEKTQTIRIDCDSTTDVDYQPKNQSDESDSDCQIVGIQTSPSSRKKIHTNQIYMIYSGAELANKSGEILISDSEDENVQINKLTSSRLQQNDLKSFTNCLRRTKSENNLRDTEMNCDDYNQQKMTSSSSDDESSEPAIYEISDNIRIALPKIKRKNNSKLSEQSSEKPSCSGEQHEPNSKQSLTNKKPRIEIISNILINKGFADSTTPVFISPAPSPWKVLSVVERNIDQNSQILESIPSNKEIFDHNTNEDPKSKRILGNDHGEKIEKLKKPIKRHRTVSFTEITRKDPEMSRKRDIRFRKFSFTESDLEKMESKIDLEKFKSKTKSDHCLHGSENEHKNDKSCQKVKKTSPRTSKDDSDIGTILLNKHPRLDPTLSPETMKSEFYSYLKINTNPNLQKTENTIQNRRSIRVRNLYKENDNKNKENKQKDKENKTDKSKENKNDKSKEKDIVRNKDDKNQTITKRKIDFPQTQNLKEKQNSDANTTDLDNDNSATLTKLDIPLSLKAFKKENFDDFIINFFKIENINYKSKLKNATNQKRIHRKQTVLKKSEIEKRKMSKMRHLEISSKIRRYQIARMLRSSRLTRHSLLRVQKSETDNKTNIGKERAMARRQIRRKKDHEIEGRKNISILNRIKNGRRRGRKQLLDDNRNKRKIGNDSGKSDGNRNLRRKDERMEDDKNDTENKKSDLIVNKKNDDSRRKIVSNRNEKRKEKFERKWKNSNQLKSRSDFNQSERRNDLKRSERKNDFDQLERKNDSDQSERKNDSDQLESRNVIESETTNDSDQSGKKEKANKKSNQTDNLQIPNEKFKSSSVHELSPLDQFDLLAQNYMTNNQAYYNPDSPEAFQECEHNYSKKVFPMTFENIARVKKDSNIKSTGIFKHKDSDILTDEESTEDIDSNVEMNISTEDILKLKKEFYQEYSDFLEESLDSTRDSDGNEIDKESSGLYKTKEETRKNVSSYETQNVLPPIKNSDPNEESIKYILESKDGKTNETVTKLEVVKPDVVTKQNIEIDIDKNKESQSISVIDTIKTEIPNELREGETKPKNISIENTKNKSGFLGFQTELSEKSLILIQNEIKNLQETDEKLNEKTNSDVVNFESFKRNFKIIEIDPVREIDFNKEINFKNEIDSGKEIVQTADSKSYSDNESSSENEDISEIHIKKEFESDSGRRSQIESGSEFDPKIDNWLELSQTIPVPIPYETIDVPVKGTNFQPILTESSISEFVQNFSDDILQVLSSRCKPWHKRIGCPIPNCRMDHSLQQDDYTKLKNKRSKTNLIKLDETARVKPFHRSLQSSSKMDSSIDPFQEEINKTQKQTHQVTIDHQDGPVFCSYYTDGTLILIQEYQIGFWKQTPLGNVLGASNMWYSIGKTKRYVFEKGCVCRRACDMVTSAEGSVAYIEVWTKEHSSEFRQLPVTDIFVTVYHHKGYGALDKKVLQLENIKGYGKNVRYCVMRYSREIVVSWRDQLDPKRTYIRAFELTSDFQTIINIREFKNVYEELTSMHIITSCDSLVIGATENKLFVWNVKHGWLVKTIDFTDNSPALEPKRHLCLKALCETGYLFVIQQTKKRFIRLVGVNGVSGQWKQLQLFRIPRNYNTLLGTSTESGTLMLSYPNGFLCYDMQSGKLLAETEFEQNRIVLPADKFLVYVSENGVSVKHVMLHILEHENSQDDLQDDLQRIVQHVTKQVLHYYNSSTDIDIDLTGDSENFIATPDGLNKASTSGYNQQNNSSVTIKKFESRSTETDDVSIKPASISTNLVKTIMKTKNSVRFKKDAEIIQFPRDSENDLIEPFKKPKKVHLIESSKNIDSTKMFTKSRIEKILKNCRNDSIKPLKKSDDFKIPKINQNILMRNSNLKFMKVPKNPLDSTKMLKGSLKKFNNVSTEQSNSEKKIKFNKDLTISKYSDSILMKKFKKTLEYQKKRKHSKNDPYHTERCPIPVCFKNVDINTLVISKKDSEVIRSTNDCEMPVSKLQTSTKHDDVMVTLRKHQNVTTPTKSEKLSIKCPKLETVTFKKSETVTTKMLTKSDNAEEKRERTRRKPENVSSETVKFKNIPEMSIKPANSDKNIHTKCDGSVDQDILPNANKSGIVNDIDQCENTMKSSPINENIIIQDKFETFVQSLYGTNQNE